MNVCVYVSLQHHFVLLELKAYCCTALLYLCTHNFKNTFILFFEFFLSEKVLKTTVNAYRPLIPSQPHKNSNRINS